MFKKINHKLFSEKGQALVETGLIIVLVSIVAITALTATGQCVNTGFDNIATVLGAGGGGDTEKLVPSIEGTTFHKADGTLLTPGVDKYEDIAYLVGPKKSWGPTSPVPVYGGTKDDGYTNTENFLRQTRVPLATTANTIWEFCAEVRSETGDNGWYVPASQELVDTYRCWGYAPNFENQTGTSMRMAWSSTEDASGTCPVDLVSITLDGSSAVAKPVPAATRAMKYFAVLFLAQDE